MLPSDKEIIQKSYSLYKTTGNLKGSVKKVIGKEKINSKRLSNIVIALNQSVRARFKKDKNHSKVFTPITVSDLSEVAEVFKKDSSKKKRDLSGYSMPYTSKKESTNTYNAGDHLFRNIIEDFRKVAHAKTQGDEIDSVLSSDLSLAHSKTMILIKEASKSNSILQVETALSMYSPENSSMASSISKVACKSLLKEGNITEKQYTQFCSIDRNILMDKVASQEMEVEENELTDSYADMICARDSKIVNENRMEYITKRADECFSVYEKISGRFLSPGLNINEKLSFINREVENPHFCKKLEFISNKVANSGEFFKSMGQQVGGSLAALGIVSGIGAIGSSFKDLMQKDKNNKGYYAMIGKSPMLKDTEETREMFDSIVESNPGMSGRPIQTGKMLATLQEQGQIVTPDMMQSLVKGYRPPSTTSASGQIGNSVASNLITSSLKG